MQFLFVMRVKESAAPITSEQRESEVAYLRATYGMDIVRQVWSRGDAAGACLLIEASDEGEACAAIEALPLMRAGKLDIQLCVPLQAYRGFADARK